MPDTLSMIPFIDMIACLSKSVDIVNPVLNDHHKQVAYIAGTIAEELGLSQSERQEVVIAAALHDIGGLSLTERLESLNFDIVNPHPHAYMGYLLLKDFPDLTHVALMIKYHHVPWNDKKRMQGLNIPLGSQIIHLADRISVLIKANDARILEQVPSIIEIIRNNRGVMFNPDLVDVFLEFSEREYFWLDILYQTLDGILKSHLAGFQMQLDTEHMLLLSNIFREVIDYRSPFTATHSIGVAYTAEALSRLVGFDDTTAKQMRTAGYLHDLGKLAVPNEILEKKGGLSIEEFNIIRSHTYHTYMILEPMKELQTINEWASFHHERLNGEGYPFHLKESELSLGSRIVAVADVFTAIKEERPYRKSMSDEEALKTLDRMVSGSILDGDLVALLKKYYDQLEGIRVDVQKPAYKEYRKFMDNSKVNLKSIFGM